jgi:D-beta-D-heptose 7-phosphate kinase/D-beta-D-heptose 1-phosphate adenosyltransferase
MKKVLVIGDGCQDIFRYGTCDRLCPEAPVPVFVPTRFVINGGMVINVYENLKALGVNCDIVTNDDRPIKTRYVDEVSNQMILRVDEKDRIKRIGKKDLKLIDFSKYYAIVISDYNKGFLEEEDIKYITDNHNLTFVDSKKNFNFSWSDNIKYIKINEKEFNANKEYLTNRYKNNLIVTVGKNGAILNNKDHFKLEHKTDVKDLCGAGDTFFAALVADFIKNDNICTAITFANKCASWAVSQKGVTVIDASKVCDDGNLC